MAHTEKEPGMKKLPTHRKAATPRLEPPAALDARERVSVR